MTRDPGDENAAPSGQADRTLPEGRAARDLTALALAGLLFAVAFLFLGASDWLTRWAHQVPRVELAALFLVTGFLLLALSLFTLRRIRDLHWEQRQRREALRALEASARRYVRLAENAQDILFLYYVAPQPRFEYVSPASTRLLGYAPEEFYAEPLLHRRIIHPDSRDQALDGRNPPSLTEPLTLRCVHRDGRDVWLELRMTPTHDAAGKVVSIEGVGRDTTDRIRSEEERKAQREIIARQERLAALGTLVAGVAHEVNNPLMYMRGNVELALMDLDALSGPLSEEAAALGVDLEAMAQGLRSAVEGADRIAWITKSLRVLTREESEERQRVDLRGVILSMSRLVTVRLPDSVELAFELGSEPLPVWASASELHQVFLNLLQNSIEALGDAPGRVHVRAEVLEGVVAITVTDNGPGIPPEARPRLFTPFFTTRADGTGLGLSIAYTIVKDHGGDLAFTPVPEGGACFRVSLPRLDSTAEGRLEAGEGNGMPSLSGLTVPYTDR